jgi:GNAT superfamily N-acetyltransferase
MDYTVRAMALQDGPAIRRLDEMSPDSGAFSVVYRCLFDPYEVTMALHPGSLGVVAENPADKTLAGKAFVQLSLGRFQGALRPLGRLFGLVVHPDHRRRGLATTLYHKLLELARKISGPETMFLAAIQEGNEASLRAAKTWATQIVEGRTRYLFARTVIRPPRIRQTLRIRTAELKDWAAVAEGTTRFRQNSELATEVTPEVLQEFHERQPFGFPLQTCIVAVNAEDRPVAGMSVVFDGLVETGLYPDFPPTLRFLNRFLRFAPSNGVLKPLSVRDLWYAPGFEGAALDLWRTAAWQLRDKGNRLMAAVDPKSPLAAVLPKSSFLPFEGGLLALAVDKPVDLSRTLYLPF